jgi:phosphoesterase RecJ-like protein
MQKLLDYIEKYETIIIHRHIRPDPDALGSQAGLAFLIKDNFPKKRVLMVGEEVESLRFISKMDEVKDDDYEGALVIVCDTANQERVSDSRFKNGAVLLKIDHHPNNDLYGDWLWVNTEASSVSEMIASLYESHPKLTLSDEAARVLYAGIVGDTGRFLFNSTTPQTYRLTARLLERQVNQQGINDELDYMPLPLARLQGVILQTFEILEGGAGVVRLPQTLLAEYGLTAQLASTLVNCFANVEGLKAWVFFIEEPEQIRVRLRSKGPIVNKIAEAYNGGGHPMASGATAFDWETCEQIVKDLQAACLTA